jgi:hypothetical protein
MPVALVALEEKLTEDLEDTMGKLLVGLLKAGQLTLDMPGATIVQEPPKVFQEIDLEPDLRAATQAFFEKLDAEFSDPAEAFQGEENPPACNCSECAEPEWNEEDLAEAIAALELESRLIEADGTKSNWELDVSDDEALYHLKYLLLDDTVVRADFHTQGGEELQFRRADQ